MHVAYVSMHERLHLACPRRSVPLSYLRLTLAEYRVISRECFRLNLGRCSRPAFRRGLVAALQDHSSTLAEKVAALRRPQIRLLHEHFYERPGAAVREPSPELSADEWVTFAEACVSYPLPVRFVRPFRHMLVELFREVSPELARKLEGLSGRQFEQLYGQATERKRGSA
jgi:hypothetical protein